MQSLKPEVVLMNSLSTDVRKGDASCGFLKAELQAGSSEPKGPKVETRNEFRTPRSEVGWNGVIVTGTVPVEPRGRMYDQSSSLYSE